VSNVQPNEISSAPSTPSPAYIPIRFNPKDRRTFIGGSDARIIMGDDEAELIRLWREKRGEVAGRSADNLVVQLGAVTENLNRRWYHRNTGFTNKDLS
jgi:predicted phage-related endonuclease